MNPQNRQHILAIRRDKRYSLGAEEKDKQILLSVIRHLNQPIEMIDEAQFTSNHEADIYLSMGRLPQTLEILRQKQAQGKRIINLPSAVEMCGRKQIARLMRDNNIPMPPQKGQYGYWLKRGDALAPSENDVIYCANEHELEHNKAQLHQRGILSSVESAHVPGDVVKFYGIEGGFFRWYRRHTEEQGYTFNVTDLQQEAFRLAHIIGLEVFGGDCIVQNNGSFCLIDFNDWPSFAPCKDEAGSAIAKLIY